MKAPEILQKAAQHMQDRAATYDKPEGERSMAQTVAIFNQFHGTSLTEAQGWHMMQILKDVRLFARPGYHADSGEDGVAYGALKCEALSAQAYSAADDNDGWIEWGGGECPVPAGTNVRVRFRNCSEKDAIALSPDYLADNEYWKIGLPGNNRPHPNDIIAYKIL